MKNFLISILILFILVAIFSTFETRIEFEYPFGNWGLQNDNSNQSISSPSKDNVFDINVKKQQNTNMEKLQYSTLTGDSNPISVEVVTENATSTKDSTNLEPINQVLYCIIIIVYTLQQILIIILIIQNIKLKQNGGKKYDFSNLC